MNTHLDDLASTYGGKGRLAARLDIGINTITRRCKQDHLTTVQMLAIQGLTMHLDSLADDLNIILAADHGVARYIRGKLTGDAAADAETILGYTGIALDPLDAHVVWNKAVEDLDVPESDADAFRI